jgi:hypothetical protein
MKMVTAKSGGHFALDVMFCPAALNSSSCSRWPCSVTCFGLKWRADIAAENLFLRRQLGLYRERKARRRG